MAKRNQGGRRDVHRQVFVQCRPNAETQRAIEGMSTAIARSMAEVPFLLSCEKQISLQTARREVMRAFVYFNLTCCELAFF